MNPSLNRFLWGIAFLVLATSSGWAQSTWRGQAEVWSTATAPVDGFVVATNDFPRNSLLTVENYKTKKTVEVRVVSALPKGSSALVLLNAKAAQALDIRAGETPLVGVRLSATGIERADNPDPDVNPLAETLPIASSPELTAAPVVVAPETKPAPATANTPPSAVVSPPRTPSASSLEIVQGSTKLDPDLLPLPVLADPIPVPEPARVPLAVAEETGAPAPLTPGRKVFLTTREPEPVAVEAPVVEAPTATETPVEPVVAETPLPEATVADTTEAPLVETPLDENPIAENPQTETPIAETPVAETVPPETVSPETNTAETPPAAVPATETSVAEATPPPTPVVELPTSPSPNPRNDASVAKAAPVTPGPVGLPSSSAWVPSASKLEGPLLGQVALVGSLEKGRSYIQVGAWSDEAAVFKVLDTVKTYVPLVLYRAEGEKNPWRLLVASAPKAQLGVLLMSFRSQGFRSAAVIKG